MSKFEISTLKLTFFINKNFSRHIHFNGLKIAESSAYKYLGVMMDKSLTLWRTLRENSSKGKLKSQIVVQDKTEIDASRSRNNI